MATGAKELNEALVQALPDGGPVVMVNLVRFLETARDGEGSGWDAYLRYSRLFMPLLKACGGAILWSGDAEGLAYGALDGPLWDYVVLVQYPSRAAFLRTVTSADYERANVHRENAVADHVIIAASETYSKFARSAGVPPASSTV
jgi:uncharacterized protein (DUF1330 family)